jgi:hypothetical protein
MKSFVRHTMIVATDQTSSPSMIPTETGEHPLTIGRTTPVVPCPNSPLDLAYGLSRERRGTVWQSQVSRAEHEYRSGAPTDSVVA